MTQNLRNQGRILDAGDDPEFAAAFGTGLDVDRKDALEALHPAHGGRRLVGVDAPGSLRHDAFAVFEVGREDPVKSGQVEPRPGDQGGEGQNLTVNLITATDLLLPGCPFSIQRRWADSQR